MRKSAGSGTDEPIFLGEYKAAHKLRAETIAQVLASPPSDLFFQVLLRRESGRSDSKETKEEIVAKVLCQTFDYMIRSGVLYGYLSSGHSLILLKIEESAPWRLFFHYTPVTHVRDFEARRSPVAQLATLAMLALRSERKPAQWISDAEKCLIKWPHTSSDYIPADELRRLRDHGGDTSDESGEPDNPVDRDYVPPFALRRQFKQSGSSQPEGGQRRRSPRKRSAPQEDFPYCTQECLSGLVHGLSLDPACPNIARHRRGMTTTKHLLTREDLSRLTRKQLARNLDEGCICMDRWGFYGATGVLFKITLTGYGYTFVGKGVQSVDEPLLEHESRVYARLASIQGTRIPVYLGIITLQRPYPLVSLARVTQMMLMSWGGESLEKRSWPDNVDISAERKKTLQALESSGVIHDDIRDANLVWNSERQMVMAIDFDRTTIVHPRKRRASPSSQTPPKLRGVERGGPEEQSPA
ncbi:hypothetical protein VTN31DRAFT_2385 [Thermomyces dupontii]|uniref:uncharacterized protein n=1 Tax=Talaromyces thermophilus TaxID=28565 RepID=UPI00374482D7